MHYLGLWKMMAEEEREKAARKAKAPQCCCEKPSRSYGNSCGKCGKDIPAPKRK